MLWSRNYEIAVRGDRLTPGDGRFMGNESVPRANKKQEVIMTKKRIIEWIIKKYLPEYHLKRRPFRYPGRNKIRLEKVTIDVSRPTD